MKPIKLNPLAERLVRLADSCGHWVSSIVHFPNRLAELGIDQEDIDPDTIRKADAFQRRRYDSLIAEIMDQKKTTNFWKQFAGSRAARLLAKLADSNGGVGAHLRKPRYADQLSRIGFRVEDLTDDLLQAAVAVERLAAERVAELIDEVNAPILAAQAARGVHPLDEGEVERRRKSSKRTKSVSSRLREPSKRVKIFGHPTTAILRWMGSNEWGWQDAKRVLVLCGADVSDTTVKIQIRNGQRGGSDYGEVPELTSAQKLELVRKRDK
jgi:hypothetical protein